MPAQQRPLTQHTLKRATFHCCRYGSAFVSAVGSSPADALRSNPYLLGVLAPGAALIAAGVLVFLIFFLAYWCVHMPGTRTRAHAHAHAPHASTPLAASPPHLAAAPAAAAAAPAARATRPLPAARCSPAPRCWRSLRC